jgi:hypothetical protein
MSKLKYGSEFTGYEGQRIYVGMNGFICVQEVTKKCPLNMAAPGKAQVSLTNGVLVNVGNLPQMYLREFYPVAVKKLQEIGNPMGEMVDAMKGHK